MLAREWVMGLSIGSINISISISGRLSVVSMYLFTLIPGLSCSDEYLVLKICHPLVKGNLWFWFQKLSKVIIKIRFVLLFSPLNWRKRDGNQIELVWKVKSLRAVVYHKLYPKKHICKWPLVEFHICTSIFGLFWVLLVTDITWDEDEAGILQIMMMDKCYKKNDNKTARIVRDVDKMSSSLIWTLVWHDQQIR